MKNAALILVAALDAALYFCPSPQTPTEPVRTAAATPRRVATRMYFHSSLNAPAMPTSAHTGLGYFSPDDSSEFRGDYTMAAATVPVVDSPSAQGGLNWGDPNEAADLGAIQKVYKLPKVGEARPTISQ